MPTPNINSPHSTVGEEILLELRNRPLADYGERSASPQYRPTSPAPDAPHQLRSETEALEIAEAMIIMREMGEFNTLHVGNTPMISRAIRESISPIPPPTPDSEHCIPPSQEEVRDVQRMAQGIIRYRAAHPTPLNVIKEWTDHLMPAIRIMSRSGQPTHPILISDNAFDDLSHLRYIPIFTDIIDPYMEGEDRESIDDTPPTLLRRATNPAGMAHTSTQTEERDADHPGDQWMRYNPGNASHYPFSFIGADHRPRITKYIRYLNINDGVIYQGTDGKGKGILGTPLHARAFPTPNFNRPGAKDTDHTIFDPSSTSRLIVDDAIYHLGDPGIVADIHTLCAQINKLKGIKHQHIDLDNQERSANKKRLDCKRYLTHAAVHTRLQNHLLCTRPTSPPSSFLPCIFAAQGPPEDKWSDVEGEDSLEACAIPKDQTHKRKRTPFPYCLKCSDVEPDHAEGDCPLWKYCQWCFRVDHTHNDCPTPHYQCVKDTCIVPEWHPMVGNYCPVAFEDDSYELRCTAVDYEDEGLRD